MRPRKSYPSRRSVVTLRICCWLLVAAPLLLAPWARGQTGTLNDTGQTACYDATFTPLTCDVATTGNASTRPAQDGRIGRDAAAARGALTKVGGGEAGFDFTRICWNGSPEGTVSGLTPCHGTLVANHSGAPTGTPATDWACTRDNVTGLLWSLQTQTAAWGSATAVSYPDAGHNAPARCGYSTGWRLPARGELLGIAHNGPATSTAIDASYFPQPVAGPHWSATVDARSGGTGSWAVDFLDGYTVERFQTNPLSVRLVRSVGAAGGSGYVINGDGTVTDLATQLVWDRCVLGLSGPTCAGTAQALSWVAAQAAVKARNASGHLGFSDWRLPNKNELDSLLKLDTTNPAIDATAFPNTPASQHWSATTYAHSATKAWITYFSIGLTSAFDIGLGFSVRLVRGGPWPAGFDGLACDLDVDGDGLTTAAKDGVLLSRYLLGFRGASLTSGLSLTGTRNTPVLIEAFLGDARGYEVFGRPAQTPTAERDGLVMVRLMLGVPNSALLTGIAVPAGAVHTSAADVRAAVNAVCAATF